jgi:hypothetical protein
MTSKTISLVKAANYGLGEAGVRGLTDKRLILRICIIAQEREHACSFLRTLSQMRKFHSQLPTSIASVAHSGTVRNRARTLLKCAGLLINAHHR